jgi:hypothetical protein
MREMRDEKKKIKKKMYLKCIENTFLKKNDNKIVLHSIARKTFEACQSTMEPEWKRKWYSIVRHVYIEITKMTENSFIIW